MINSRLLMTGVEYFAVTELNPLVKDKHVNHEKLQSEFESIQQAIKEAGIEIVNSPTPVGCADGVYVANWAYCDEDVAILAHLPKGRESEEVHAERALLGLGKHILKAPYLFSGQGDALRCGDKLFLGHGYRTDKKMAVFLRQHLDHEIIPVQTVPLLDKHGNKIFNKATGLLESEFYDLDLAMNAVSPDLIVWCPEAFTASSQKTIRETDIKKIEVSYQEAKNFGCNLISNGKTVIMGNRAPKLRQELVRHGYNVKTLHISELSKGGGFIHCVALTI